MQKPILVTGSSGQLGRQVVSWLTEQSYSVLGIDLTPSPTTHQLLDIRHFEAVRDVTRGVEAVIHTAALHGRHTDLGYPRQAFVDTNITGTLHLLTACCQQGITKLIYTSTTSIYGKAMVQPSQAVWVDEALAPIARDIYDITKQAAENLCADFMDKEGLQICVLRVSRFLNEPANDIANYRLYRGLDVRDGAAAHGLALQKMPAQFEVFNISAHSPFKASDLVALKQEPASVIRQYYPQIDVLYARRGWQLPTSIDRVYVTEKAAVQLGYQPQYNFWDYLTGFTD